MFGGVFVHPVVQCLAVLRASGGVVAGLFAVVKFFSAALSGGCTGWWCGHLVVKALCLWWCLQDGRPPTVWVCLKLAKSIFFVF